MPSDLRSVALQCPAKESRIGRLNLEIQWWLGHWTPEATPVPCSSLEGPLAKQRLWPFLPSPGPYQVLRVLEGIGLVLNKLIQPFNMSKGPALQTVHNKPNLGSSKSTETQFLLRWLIN